MEEAFAKDLEKERAGVTFSKAKEQQEAAEEDGSDISETGTGDSSDSDEDDDDDDDDGEEEEIEEVAPAAGEQGKQTEAQEHHELSKVRVMLDSVQRMLQRTLWVAKNTQPQDVLLPCLCCSVSSTETNTSRSKCLHHGR